MDPEGIKSRGQNLVRCIQGVQGGGGDYRRD